MGWFDYFLWNFIDWKLRCKMAYISWLLDFKIPVEFITFKVKCDGASDNFALSFEQ